MPINNIQVNIFLVLLAIILVPLCRSTAEESIALQTVRSFLTEILDIETTTLIEIPGISYETGLPSKTFCFNNICKSNIIVSDDGTIIYGYRNLDWLSQEREFVTGKTHTAAIDETTAFSKIMLALNYFGLSADKAEYKIQFLDAGDIVLPQ